MSVNSSQSGKKWIQTSVAITCMFVAYVLLSFFEQINDWWHLETYVPSYYAVSQALAVLLGLGCFAYIIKNPKTSQFLNDVYYEVLKVVWPKKDETVKHSIIIMIGIAIIGFILGFFDFIGTWVLGLIS